MRNCVALRFVAVAVVLASALVAPPGEARAAQNVPVPTSTTTATSGSSTSTTSSTTTTTEPPPPLATDDVVVTPPPAGEIAATGGSTRTVVRIGALLFAVGGIATFVAAGRRPQRRPETGS